MVADTHHNSTGKKTITAGKHPKAVQVAGVIVIVPARSSVDLHLPPGCRPVVLTDQPSKPTPRQSA